jgi:DNA-binding PadR family transcriptional regulator
MTADMADDWPARMIWAFARAKGSRGPGRRDDLERMAALHHLRGGPFGAGPMFGAPFGGRGRKRRGDVRLALLLLLSEEPRNGYQLMQTIEERSDGRWRPSPGAVYPALSQLEDERLIHATEREGTKVFEITEAGREHLGERHEEAPPWEGEDEPTTVADLKGQLKQIHLAAVQVLHAGDEDQVRRAAETLAETRRALYRILAEDMDA